MQKYTAEFIGSAALVIVGCGAITMGGLGGVLGSGQPFASLAILPIGLAFGLTVMAMAYGIGPISGCHINPAVTVAAFVAGRMPASDVPGYIIAQFLGAIVGAGLLYVMLAGKVTGYDVTAAGLGQTGWSSFSLSSAVLAEFIATFLFIVVILGATSKAGTTPVAGLAIGLTLAVLHLAFVPVSGNSLNPSRSFGPAVFVGGQALAQVWMFLIVPTIAGAVAGLLFRNKTLEA
ncbi:aquaporin [Phreatobacter aquaticus]|uniref:Aquaporin n=2 Tax=Phreatobacter aquaticus TaxID=2570229 RepID=A0A4D7QS51_9HYPH|nr:aquaporin [Phreatobacter aquaticus]